MLPDSPSRSLAVVLRVRTAPSRPLVSAPDPARITSRVKGHEPRNFLCVRVVLFPLGEKGRRPRSGANYGAISCCVQIPSAQLRPSDYCASLPSKTPKMCKTNDQTVMTVLCTMPEWYSNTSPGGPSKPDATQPGNKIAKKKERPPNSPKAAHVRRRDIVKTTKYEIDSCIGRRIREED